MSRGAVRLRGAPPRLEATVEQLRTARCECGNPKKADCFRFTPDVGAWCWPCKVRWSLRPDAARFIAPVDDVVKIRAVRRKS